MRIFLILMGVAILLTGISYFFSDTKKVADPFHLIVETKNGPHTFDIEVAATPSELERGLMFRNSLPPDSGMLFELGREVVIRFWMKDTLISLDMVFIGADGTIRKIHEKAVPKSLEPISSDMPVKAVLEINGGRARALGMNVGDKVIHPYFMF